MVCDRCILIVRQQLEQLGFMVLRISLGVVELKPVPDAEQLVQISAIMQGLGFELISKDKDRLIEQVKSLVIELVHQDTLSDLNTSPAQLIAERLHREYAYLSRLFSETEGLTIEKYIIQQKVARVKELLEYGELKLNEIAFRMGYSSSSHLSTQFKAVTGMSPSQYRAVPPGMRQSLDQII